MRKSFVGDEAQKWAYPQLWAWACKRGRAHFARPSPHVLGARTKSSVGNHTFAWAAKARGYWASTYAGGRPKIGSQSRTSGRPRHTVLDSHIYGWRLTKICGLSRTNMGAQDGDDWWPTHIGGRPKTATMGIHMLRVGAQGVGILDDHTHLRAPTKICATPCFASGYPVPETWTAITHLRATTYCVMAVQNICVESHV